MKDCFYKSELIDLSQGPEDIQTLLTYWHELCHGSDMPLKEDIAPWDFPAQLSRICLIEVQQDPLDFIYRIDGTNTSVSATSDLRNKSILDGDPVEIYREMYNDLAETVKLAAPVLWHASYYHDDFSYDYLRLILPLKKDIPGDTLMTFSFNLESDDGKFDAIR